MKILNENYIYVVEATFIFIWINILSQLYRSKQTIFTVQSVFKSLGHLSNSQAINTFTTLSGVKVTAQHVSKRMFFVKLLFFGSTSLQTRKKLEKLFTNKLTSCNLKILFTSPTEIKSLLNFKDKLPKMLLSGPVYKVLVAVVLPIIVRPNVILISEFLKVSAFHISSEKRWRLKTVI